MHELDGVALALVELSARLSSSLVNELPSQQLSPVCGRGYVSHFGGSRAGAELTGAEEEDGEGTQFG